MTEYDYSPEAYERHMATQNRIARWVDNTQQYVPVNPFVPPTPLAPQPQDLSDSHSRSNSNSRSHSTARDRDLRYPHSSSGRPPPTRSYTAPPRGVVYGPQYPQDSKHSHSQYSLAQTQTTQKPSHSRRSSHSSSKRSPTSHHSSSRPPPSRSQTYNTPPVPSPAGRHPVRSNTTPIYGYTAGDGRNPIPMPNGGYMVIPPKGKRVEIISPQSYYPPQPFPQPTSPTKQQPLLKRLLTGLTRGSSKNSSNGSKRRGRRSSF